MNIKVADLMSAMAITSEPHKSLGHVRRMMERNKVSAIPIVSTEGEPVGIVSATDLLSGLDDNSPVGDVMTKKVFTVPKYDDVSIAARVMRNHRIHRVVVTHEKRVVGVISAFDLLKLVEDHRYVEKNAPTISERKRAKRQ